MDDALDFYEKAPGGHVVKALYLGEGREEEVFYVDKPEEWSGDPDVGMDVYNLARSYPTFITGSVEAPTEEFTYLDGFRIVKRR